MKKIALFLLCALSSLTQAHADEGMWTLYNLDQRTYDKMKTLGFTLTQDQLYNKQGNSLKDCVVLFGGFCSGVVVSDQGLVFTNHHCGYAAINALATTEDDILKNGFAAKTLADERPAEGLWVAFLEDVVDLTSQADAHVNVDSIGRAYEQAHPGYMTSVDQFYGGTVTLMQVYKKYRDVRLAFAPTESLGKFGGDTDNWMWPRHTSDFSVFRVYTAPDGSPADYSADNVPLRPKRWARVNINGFSEGDYCMTVGFPGSTSRYMSSWGIENRMDCINEAMISVRGVKQAAWQKWMDSDRAIDLKYSTKYAQSSNYWKNSIGMNRALKMLGVVERKQALQQEIAAWVAQDPARQAKYGKMLEEMAADYATVHDSYRALYFTYETRNSVDLFRNSSNLQQIMVADSADRASVAEAAKARYKNYDWRVDRDAAVAVIGNYFREVPRRYQFQGLRDEIRGKFNGNIGLWADCLFASSPATDISGVYMALNPDYQSYIYHDPASVGIGLRTQMMILQADNATALERIAKNEELLTQAILDMQTDQPHYSDANMTMRLSYGSIKDYTGTDGVHQDAQTWPAQLIDKTKLQETTPDYKLEAELVKLMSSGDWGRYADRKKGDLPLCFLSTNDITGGNSGSPMFNGKGELIGLAFDGNWDAMSGDITFEPSLQRCIGVDIRWVMFLMDKWAHADRLVNEVLK
ncbi:MAG: S46 family peptidase [Bacteroidaceae bacterium]|nr:S46 family peptidase [Bacteroidaceae bacterium]